MNEMKILKPFAERHAISLDWIARESLRRFINMGDIVAMDEVPPATDPIPLGFAVATDPATTATMRVNCYWDGPREVDVLHLGILPRNLGRVVWVLFEIDEHEQLSLENFAERYLAPAVAALWNTARETTLPKPITRAELETAPVGLYEITGEESTQEKHFDVVNFLYLANVRCRRLARVAPNEGPLPHGVDISVRRDGMRVYEVWDPIDPDTAERYDFRNDRIIKPE